MTQVSGDIAAIAADPWAWCDHDWQEVTHDYDSMHEQVRCTKCGCPGERYTDGEVVWPAT
jgi:hypothetical protein